MRLTALVDGWNATRPAAARLVLYRLHLAKQRLHQETKEGEERG